MPCQRTGKSDDSVLRLRRAVYRRCREANGNRQCAGTTAEADRLNATEHAVNGSKIRIDGGAAPSSGKVTRVRDYQRFIEGCRLGGNDPLLSGSWRRCQRRRLLCRPGLRGIPLPLFLYVGRGQQLCEMRFP